MKYFIWLLKAAIFIALFAFALKNDHEAIVKLFFGAAWHAPMVLVILASFAVGLLVGALGMVPRWWKHRSEALRARGAPQVAGAPTTTTATHGL